MLVRVHSECLTGDVFHSRRCDCGEQLEHALARVDQEGGASSSTSPRRAAGIGLLNKLRAYELQESGLDTVEANLELGLPADAREYGIGSQILADLGLTTIRVLTNNPKKMMGLAGFGLTVVSQEPIEMEPNHHNRAYLEAKRDKLGHTIGARSSSGSPLESRRPRGSLGMSEPYDRTRWEREDDAGEHQPEVPEEPVVPPEPPRDARRPRVVAGGRGAGGAGARGRRGAEPSRQHCRRQRSSWSRARADEEPEPRRHCRRQRSSWSPSPRWRTILTPSRSRSDSSVSSLSRTSTRVLEVPRATASSRGWRTGGGAPSGSWSPASTARSRASCSPGALEELEKAGVAQDAVTVMPVPGAFELPIGAMALARTRRFACVVALGCVIRGDTPHFDYVASEAASGLQLAALETGVPVAFGVLTLDREDQAAARLDKGAEAVRTALEMADLFSHLRAAAAR